MNENMTKRNELLAQTVIKGLESRNMSGYYAATKEEALKKALALNNLSTGWTVKKDLYIYHHTKDDMVPFVNYTNIMNGIGKSSFVTSCADTTEITINPSNPADFIHGKSSNVFHNVIRQELGQ